MERQLLARSRFFNSSQSLDELLQKRYSRTGDQKNFLTLKPTGSNNANNTSYNNSNSGSSSSSSSRSKQQQPSLLHALQSNGLSEDPNSEENGAARSTRDKNIPSNKVGPVNPNVQWDKKPVQTSRSNQNSRFAKKQVKRNSTKHQREKSRLLLEKKSKKTTRLVFRQYVKTTVARQRKVAAIITKIRNDVKSQIERGNIKGTDISNNNTTSSAITSKKLQSLLTKHNIPQYQTYAHLSLLWNNYIADLLRLDKTSNLQQTLTKLSSAEFIGAIARVINSNDTTLLNLTGLILYEFKNYFVFVIPSRLKFGPNVTIAEQNNMLSQDADFDQFTASELVGGLRLIEKKSCVFKIILPYSSPPPASAKVTGLSKKKQKGSTQTANKFEEPVSQTTEDDHEHQLRVDDSNNFLEFLIIGARFNYKAIDRSNKKFKNHNVNDLGILMPKD